MRTCHETSENVKRHFHSQFTCLPLPCFFPMAESSQRPQTILIFHALVILMPRETYQR